MKLHRPIAGWIALLALSGCAGGPSADAPAAPSASGRFETVSLHVPASGDWYAADLDLDGRDELLLTQPSGRTRVYAFDGASLEQVTSLPAAKWLAIADITADGRPDVLLGGDTFKGFRGQEERNFSPLQAESVPLSGESSGRISVTSFPIVGRWQRNDQPEPLVVKDVYDLSLLTPKPTQVESFFAFDGEVASVGNAELELPLNLRKRFVAMDFDGDGLDELWGVDFLGKLTQLRPSSPNAGAAWRVLESWSVDDPSRLTLRDADGDGALDVVGAGSALVVTGGRVGVAGRVHRFELPRSAEGCVWIQLDADPQRELACAGASGDEPSEPAAYDADYTRDELAARSLPELALQGQLLVGDFDGNGVEDLAAVDEELVVSLGIANE